MGGEGEGLCGGSWGELEKAVGGGGELCVGAVSQHCGESDTGEVCMWEELCGGSCVGEAVGELCFLHVTFLIHSQKCSICYSVACFSECVAEVVFVVQLSQTL